MPTRSLPFLIIITLFGLGLGFIVSSLDPIIYTEKVRQIAPPGLKNTALSFITIMALLVALIAQPLIGHWSDRTESRWGPRIPFLTGGVVGLNLALALLALTESLWLLVIAAMLISAFSNTVQGPWQALVPDTVPKNQHGLAAGIKTLLEAVGAISGVAIVTLSVARGQLWLSLLAAAALFWVILLPTLFTLWRVDGQGSQHRQPSQPSLPADYFSLSRLTAIFRETPIFFWWIVNRLLFWSAGIGVRTFLLNYMEDVLNLPLANIEKVINNGWLIIGGGVALLLVLLAGVMADRLGRRPLLIAAGALAASGSLLLIFVRDVTGLLAATTLVVGGASIFISASWALATDLTPQAQGALYLGIANGATVIGSISGRLGGPLIDGVNQLTHTTHLGYSLVFGIAALCFAGSSLVVAKISPSTP